MKIKSQNLLQKILKEILIKEIYLKNHLNQKYQQTAKQILCKLNSKRKTQEKRIQLLLIKNNLIINLFISNK